MLKRAKVAHIVHEYDHDPSNHHFGEETVEAMGVDPRRTFKTLVAELTGGPEPTVCAVVPVSGQLDLKALAQAAGAKKAVMADPADAERITGYVVGGISRSGRNVSCRSTSTRRHWSSRPCWSRVAARDSQLSLPLVTWPVCSTPPSPISDAPGRSGDDKDAGISQSLSSSRLRFA